MLRTSNYVFSLVPIFHKDPRNMSFHGNQIGDIVAIGRVRKIAVEKGRPSTR